MIKKLKKPVSIIFRSSLFLVLLFFISGCWYHSSWKDIVEKESNDLPWNGPNSRITVQTRQFYAPMMPTGSQTEIRWYNSFFDKNEELYYGNKIDDFFIKESLIEKCSRKWSDDRKPFPYEFNLISVNPIIVILTTNNVKESKPIKKEANFKQEDYELLYYIKEGYKLALPKALSTKCIKNVIRYGSSFNYSSNLMFFSPDLSIKPTKISLEKGGLEKITFGKEAIILKERDGIVYTTRVIND